MLCQGILAQCPPNASAKGRRFESHRGQAYFSSLPGVDITLSRVRVTSHKHLIHLSTLYTPTQQILFLNS